MLTVRPAACSQNWLNRFRRRRLYLLLLVTRLGNTIKRTDAITKLRIFWQRHNRLFVITLLYVGTGSLFSGMNKYLCHSFLAWLRSWQWCFKNCGLQCLQCVRKCRIFISQFYDVIVFGEWCFWIFFSDETNNCIIYQRVQTKQSYLCMYALRMVKWDCL